MCKCAKIDFANMVTITEENRVKSSEVETKNNEDM